MRGVPLVHHRGRLKINSPCTRCVQVGPKIARRDKMGQRRMAEHMRRKESAAFEETAKSPELLQGQTVTAMPHHSGHFRLGIKEGKN
jgi:hypothetical protein